MKVHILTISGGSYEYHWSEIAGVYLSIETAEKAGAYIISRANLRDEKFKGLKGTQEESKRS